MNRFLVRVLMVGGVIAIIVIIAIVLGQPAYRFERSKCHGDLKLLGNAIQTYQVDHQGQLPTMLTVLSNELSNPAFLICAGSGHKPGSFSDADTWADYSLVNWSMLVGTNPIPSAYPIAYDGSMANHGGRGINVLGVDGFVRWDPMAEGLKKFAAEHPNFKLHLPE